jgi:hypothetical protein
MQNYLKFKVGSARKEIDLSGAFIRMLQHEKRVHEKNGAPTNTTAVKHAG